MNPEIELRWLRSPDDLTAPFALRIRVFCDEQGYALLLADGTPAGTGRLYWRSAEEGCMGIGRLAVDQVWRGHGFGSILVKEMEKRAERMGASTLLLDAQTRAIGFYEKLGYAVCGEEHMDGHVPHKMMKKRL